MGWAGDIHGQREGSNLWEASSSAQSTRMGRGGIEGHGGLTKANLRGEVATKVLILIKK